MAAAAHRSAITGSLAKIDRALELKPTLTSAKIRRIAALAEFGDCKKAKLAMKEVVSAVPATKAVAEEAFAPCTGKKGR